MNPQKTYHSKKSFFLILIVSALIFSSISLVNHFLYRTYALDLGLYTNSLFDYAHFTFNDSSVFKNVPQNLLADHFDLFLVIISPLSYLFGNSTLLLVQIAFLLIGGIGVYRYLQLKEVEERIALLGMLYFYLHFSVFSALSFDYHSNVIAASIVPWLFYFFEKKEKSNSLFVLGLILITKENMALWMIFVTFGFWLLNRKREGYNFILFFTALSTIYFFIVTSFLMPMMSNDNTFVQFKYSILGSDYKSAFTTLFYQPLLVFKSLFINTSSSITGDYVKWESWLFFFFSGGIVLLFRPLWLLMLVPIFLQKFLHNQIQMWGINDQYSIEFAPILALGIFSSGNSSLPTKVRNLILSLAFLGSVICTIRLMDRTSSMIKRANVRLYQPAHWKAEMDVRAINAALKFIPDTAIVSSQSPILPHLAWRDKIYTFPIIKDAEFIVYEKAKAPYPISVDDFSHITDSLENSSNWKIVYKENNVRLLKRVLIDKSNRLF